MVFELAGAVSIVSINAGGRKCFVFRGHLIGPVGRSRVAPGGHVSAAGSSRDGTRHGRPVSIYAQPVVYRIDDDLPGHCAFDGDAMAAGNADPGAGRSELENCQAGRRIPGSEIRGRLPQLQSARGPVDLIQTVQNLRVYKNGMYR